MKYPIIALLSSSLCATLMLTYSVSFAEDWAISATASCEATLGNVINSGGGIKASGGTAVVRCPLTKESGFNTINSVYVRMKRVSASGADPFCYLYNTSNFGSPTSFVNKFASDTTANQSVSLNLGTQYSYGYADVYCVLNNGDTMYGVRYLQDN